MYENYNTIKDDQGWFRAMRPGTAIVIYRDRTEAGLYQIMRSLQVAYENGVASGERQEKIRIRVLLELNDWYYYLILLERMVERWKESVSRIVYWNICLRLIPEVLLEGIPIIKQYRVRLPNSIRIIS